MAGRLEAGKRRVFANCGVGRLTAGRWADVDENDARLEGWLAAGLISETGNRGEAPPEVLTQMCCGNK
jgi:hypothetical protein